MKVFYFILPLIYIFFNAPFGFEGTDTSFILGLSWQFFNGKMLYKDIFYIRPPISIILHSGYFYFTTKYAVILSRIFMILQFFIINHLSMLMISKKFKIHMDKLIPLFIISFILSIHNFPIMPWHTVDGIFFSIIGIYLLENNSQKYAFIFGGVSIALAALCKQSFYLMPLFTLTYLFFDQSKKKIPYFVIGLIIPIIFFISWLNANHIFSDYISLTTGQTKISDLINIGIKTYTKKIPIFIFIIMGYYFITKKLKISKYSIHSRNLIFIVISLFSIYASLSTKSFGLYFKNFPDYFFGASCIICFYFIYQKKTDFLLILLMLFTAWSASISWGYRTTGLLFAPIIFIFYYDLIDINFIKSKFYIPVIASLFICFQIAFLYPYRNLPKYNLTNHLGDRFKNLKYIYADNRTLERLESLQSLYNITPGKNVILPAENLAYFIFNNLNHSQSNWPMNTEINNLSDKMVSLIINQKHNLIIDNNEITTSLSNDPFFVNLIPLLLPKYKLKFKNSFYSYYEINQ